MNWKPSPSRYSVSPAATRRRPNIRPSRRCVSLPVRPQGRQRSRRWQVEHCVFSGATVTGATRMVRTGASNVAVVMLWFFLSEESGDGSCRGADRLRELVEFGGFVEEAHGPGTQIALAVGRSRVVAEYDKGDVRLCRPDGAQDIQALATVQLHVQHDNMRL